MSYDGFLKAKLLASTVLVSSLSLGLAAQVHAQAATGAGSSSGASTVQELVVTGSRIPQRRTSASGEL